MTPDVVWLTALTVTGALSLWIGLSFGRHHHPCVQCGHPNAKCGRMCGKCEALARRRLATTDKAEAQRAWDDYFAGRRDPFGPGE